MEMETVSQTRSHGGMQGVYRHQSRETGTEMTFSVFVPDHAPGATMPVLWYLSGLTCTHANVTEKGEFRAACAEHGIIFIAPDTSPRGEGVPDAEGYDFGQGAGFYVDATQTPWAANFRMRSYIEDELSALIGAEFAAVDMARQGITGHSMGGHGTWQLASLFPDRFAAAAPSAGWISFASYGSGNGIDAATPIGAILARASLPSDTLKFRDNLTRMGVYVLHGDADDNVPVSQARAMRAELGQFHPDFAYHEQPGQGHWWGNECVDWPPLLRFLEE
ncbi:MAG TPA: alpha/beta hydrolase-fold protein, partial [Novosphingobium sp.]|nr:alpha/beta hydrolase-fold protein [Novosphingobium sp.]